MRLDAPVKSPSTLKSLSLAYGRLPRDSSPGYWLGATYSLLGISSISFKPVLDGSAAGYEFHAHLTSPLLNGGV